ncbi:MAG: hypothetical protein M9932_11470 [Xanthobacteraceae bacterium]|nr:hypothetical protein [Xanthobacteraceae bacterium]
MKWVSVILLGVALVLPGGLAMAQLFGPGVTPSNPPPPPPPPPPRIEVPAVPKLDAPPPPPKAGAAPRGSFGDRVIDCLHQGAAAGMTPGERAAYSRACANQ